ncbi:MAG: nucleoside 2-deoxyribosyltransferase [Sphingomonas bacterium]
MNDISLYLAAPLFNARERAFNLEIAERFAPFANVYLPQRDGSLLVEMLNAGVPLPVAERRVFEQDCDALRRSNLLIAILDGAHIDEGVAFEIGFARAIGCLCIGLQTDARRALPTGNNPMIGRALETIFGSEYDLELFVAGQAGMPRSVCEGGR